MAATISPPRRRERRGGAENLELGHDRIQIPELCCDDLSISYARQIGPRITVAQHAQGVDIEGGLNTWKALWESSIH